MYRHACRGILRLCGDIISEEVLFCGHSCSVLSWRALCEVCVLCAMQILLAPHFTLYIFGCMVVHLEIFRSCCQSGSRSEMEICNSILPPPKLWFESLMLLCYDGSFLSSSIMPFMGVLDLVICSRFPSAFKWQVMEGSNCKNFSEEVLGRWVAKSQLQPLPSLVLFGKPTRPSLARRNPIVVQFSQ